MRIRDHTRTAGEGSWARAITTSPWRYIFPLSGAFATGALGVALHVARKLNAPNRPAPIDAFTFSPFEAAVPWEEVAFQTDDGVTLRGWWLPRPETTRTVIACAGHRRAKHDLLGIGSGLWRAGNNVLLFDFRGCGDSDKAALSLAHHETRDARAGVQFVRQKLPGATIGIIGYSMGAAVAILIAAQDTEVRAVVADSSFVSIRDVVAHGFRRKRFPAPPFVLLADAVNQVRYGYPFAAVRPLDAVSKVAPRPILIIHGGQDEITPVEQAYELFEAAGDHKELWIVEEAAHCGAYFTDRPLYVSRVAEFFDRALNA